MGGFIMIKNQNSVQTLDLILKNALNIPGVKIDRRMFLISTFSERINADNLEELIEKGPIEYGIPKELIEKKANQLLAKRTMKSSAISFGLGLPGGVAMSGTIPGDIVLFFSQSLIIAQELAYLFGFNDLLDDNDLSIVENKEIMLFLGTMFGINSSSSVLKNLCSQVSKQIAKKLPQKTLTKTFYNPIIKKICAIIGLKITKSSFAKSTSKVVHVVGGNISDGLTFASLSKMGDRLKETLIDSAYNYSEKDYMMDYDEIINAFLRNEFKEETEMFEVEFVDIDDKYLCEDEIIGEKNNLTSISNELLKLKDLVDKEVITEAEFGNLKAKFLQNV